MNFTRYFLKQSGLWIELPWPENPPNTDARRIFWPWKFISQCYCGQFLFLVYFLMNHISHLVMTIIISSSPPPPAVFHKSLNDKSPLVFWSLPRISTDLSNTAVRMASFCPPIINFSSPLSQPLVSVPSSPVTARIFVLSNFPAFFVVLQGVTSTSLCFRFLWFSLCYLLEEKNHLFRRLSVFLLNITRFSGLLARISWSVCIPKPRRILCVLFFKTDSGLCIYHSVVCSNFNFLHSSRESHFPSSLD